MPKAGFLGIFIFSLVCSVAEAVENERSMEAEIAKTGSVLVGLKYAQSQDEVIAIQKKKPEFKKLRTTIAQFCNDKSIAERRWIKFGRTWLFFKNDALTGFSDTSEYDHPCTSEPTVVFKP